MSPEWQGGHRLPGPGRIYHEVGVSAGGGLAVLGDDVGTIGCRM